MTPSPNEAGGIKITADDLASVQVSSPAIVSPAATPSAGGKTYGTINEAAEQLSDIKAEKGSILLQGWFYLGIAGLVGALAGWAITEPGFIDGRARSWGNFVMLPSIITLMCIGFGVAESTVER